MADKTDEGFAWQVGVWDQMADIYQQEIDTRFGPVIEHLLSRANLKSGETILDLGTGTGSVAIAAATKIGPDGHIIAVDIRPEMLVKARARVRALSQFLFNADDREADQNGGELLSYGYSDEAPLA